MARSAIEAKKKAFAKQAEYLRDGQLIEYVKFLIGQLTDADRRHGRFLARHASDWQIERSDFAQTHELHTRTLAKLPFDDYAEKEENAMKTVTNDILDKAEYNSVMQHSSDPISEFKYHDDPKYNYFMSV